MIVCAAVLVGKPEAMLQQPYCAWRMVLIELLSLHTQPVVSPLEDAGQNVRCVALAGHRG